MKNHYTISDDGMIATIWLKRRSGEIIHCHVDSADLPKLHTLKTTWHVKWNNHTRSFYVNGNVLVNGKWTKIYMHVFIMEPPHGFEVHHKYHNTLDNRRSQLEIVTHQENCMNRKGAQRNSKSGHRGISPDRASGKFRFRPTIDGKLKSMGYFATIDEAIAVRNQFQEYS
jgi:hypothetical protein